MIRRSSGIAVARDWDDGGDINPMENIANVSDVMLVLAVGIMLALIMHWNVNISQTLDDATLEPVDNAEQGALDENDFEDEKKFEEVGRVYRDVETGEEYVVG